MTLSAWFRDYVYIPLGGNRGGPWRTARNLWIVFFLTGAWHGASWNFIIWGLWHGLFLSLERFDAIARLLARMPHAVRNAYVLLVVLVGWVFFRAGTLESGGRRISAACLGSALDENALGAFDLVTGHSVVMIAIAFAMALPLWPRLRTAWQHSVHDKQRIGELASAGYVAAVMLVSFAAMAGQENSPFLYFRF